MLTEPSPRLTSSSLAPVPFGPGACGPTVRGDVMRRVRGIITSLLAVLWTAPLCGQQPTGTIRGHVTDAANQQPLSGVTVAVGSRAALTQADGRYLITGVPVGTDSLRTRMMGYARATRPVTVVGGETVVVDLALTAQAVHLSEIVVTGYGAQRAGNMTGSAAQVNAGQFNTGPIVSPQLLIENKVAGLQVVDNNEPGGGLSIRIRGQASVNAGSEPLYVVDGVPLGTGSGGGLSAGRDPLNFLNPGDIDRKSTRLNSSHDQISYAVFCLKKKKRNETKLSHQ